MAWCSHLVENANDMPVHERVIEMFSEARGVLRTRSIPEKHHKRLPSAVRTSIAGNLDELSLECSVSSEAWGFHEQLTDLFADRPDIVFEVTPCRYSDRVVNRQRLQQRAGHQSTRSFDKFLDLRPESG